MIRENAGKRKSVAHSECGSSVRLAGRSPYFNRLLGCCLKVIALGSIQIISGTSLVRHRESIRSR